MTVMEMLNQGSVYNLIGMGIILILVIIMIHNIGKGVEARFAEKETPHAVVSARSADGTIAAITAAVKEYRKKH